MLVAEAFHVFRVSLFVVFGNIELVILIIEIIEFRKLFGALGKFGITFLTERLSFILPFLSAFGFFDVVILGVKFDNGHVGDFQINMIR